MAMVHIGYASPVKGAWADKAQAVKVLEEAAEVYAAWQLWHGGEGSERVLVDECCDLVTAVAGILQGLGVADLADAMDRCEERNRERGRL